MSERITEAELLAIENAPALPTAADGAQELVPLPRGAKARLVAEVRRLRRLVAGSRRTTITHVQGRDPLPPQGGNGGCYWCLVRISIGEEPTVHKDDCPWVGLEAEAQAILIEASEAPTGPFKRP